MLNLVLIATGGAAGALLRYLTGIAAARTFGAAFPFGTLGVNVVGSLAMGLLMGYLGKYSGTQEQAQALHLLLAVGLLGGFTTFSSFSLDVVTLMQRGDLPMALTYALASLLLSVAALAAGLFVMR